VGVSSSGSFLKMMRGLRLLLVKVWAGGTALSAQPARKVGGKVSWSFSRRLLCHQASSHS
jgi:hypothetical protein